MAAWRGSRRTDRLNHRVRFESEAPGGRDPRAGAEAGGCRRQPHRSPTRVTTLIAASQKHFEAGERELKLGHLDRAREEFDRAVNVLLESPYGARTERACANTSTGWSTGSTHTK